MADEIGGIQAQITANAAPFLAELKKAEQAALAFDEKFGKMNVVITATLKLPSAEAINTYQQNLQKALTAAGQAAQSTPLPAIPTGLPARGRAQTPAVSTPVGYDPHATAVTPPASTAPIQTPIARRTPVQTAVAAAEQVVQPIPIRGAKAPLTDTEKGALRAAGDEEMQWDEGAGQAFAQDVANKTGKNAQWTDSYNRIHVVKPQRKGGPAASGVERAPSFTPAPIRPPGPEELFGRGGTDFFASQQAQDDAALGRRARAAGFFAGGGPTQVGEGGGPTQEAAGLSAAQAAQRRAASPFFVSERARLAGRLGGLTSRRGADDPETIAAREALAAFQPTAPPTRRAEVAAIVKPAAPVEEDVGQAAAATLAATHTAEAQLHALAEVIGTTVGNIEKQFSTPELVEAAVAKYRATEPDFEEIYNEALEGIERQAGQAAAGGRLPRTGPTIAEKEAILKSGSDVGELLKTTARIREQAQTGLIEVQAQTQTRALPTFLASRIATSTGRPEAVEIQRESTRILAEQDRLSKGLVQLDFQRSETLGNIRDLQVAIRREEPDSDRYKELTETLEEQEGVLARQKDAVDRTKGSLEQINAEAIALDQRSKAAAQGGLRQIAASFIGGIAGSLAFGVGMAGVTAGLEAFNKAGERGFGVLTNFRDISNQISGDLAKQTIALHGLVEESTANVFAQTALSESVSNTIRPLVEQRATLESGAVAFKSQIDLIHTFANLQQQVIEGGPIPGLSTGIGGLFGTQLLAQPGIFEQLSQLSPSGRQREAQTGGALAGGAIGAVIGGGIGLFGGGVGIVPGAIAGGAIGAGIGDFAAGIATAPTGGKGKTEQQIQSAALQVQAFGLAIDDLNSSVERGTTGADNLGEAISGSTDQGKIEETQRLLEALQVPESQRNNLREAGFVLQDTFGKVLNVEQARDFGEAAARGFTIPVAKEVLQHLRDAVIPARVFQLTQTSALQRQLIQIQTGVARAGQPFLPLGTTVPPAGPLGSGIPGGLAAVSDALRPAITQARQLDRLNVQRIQAARVEIGNLALPGQSGAAQASFDRLQGLGQQAAGIRGLITQEQTNLVTAQYNEQLRQARLQMGDLAVLSGHVASSGGDNLGVLEKQNIQYQRANALLQIQLSTLQLELQQRQINFQVAIAGFAAPGTTPAEIAARQRQAELEASYAQKQLDIQKDILANQAQSVPLQIAIQDIQFQRDYISARNAIDLLTQGRQVNIDTAAAQEALERINAEIEAETANLQTFIQAGAAAAAALIADQAKYIETYTTATHDLQESAADFFQGISSEYANGLIRFLHRVNSGVQEMFGGGSGGGYQGSNYENRLQTGFYGQVSRPTSMVVGEAGAETVAVLRNPREMMWNGGGSGTQINLSVMVTGNNVRSDQDLEMLTSQVARKVEESLSRRTSLLGFRPS